MFKFFKNKTENVSTPQDILREEYQYKIFDINKKIDSAIENIITLQFTAKVLRENSPAQRNAKAEILNQQMKLEAAAEERDKTIEELKNFIEENKENLNSTKAWIIPCPAEQYILAIMKRKAVNGDF